MRWVGRLALFRKSSLARLHEDLGPRMLIEVQVNMLRLDHEKAQVLGKFIEPMHFMNARNFGRLFLRELSAFPNFDKIASLTNEEHFPLFLVRRIRKQDEHGLFLIDSRKVEEIAVLAKPHRAISIGRRDVVGMKDDQAIRLELVTETRAIGYEELRIDGAIFHESGLS